MIRKTDVLIVGGSVAGVTTAIAARRHYPDAKITVIRKEKQVAILTRTCHTWISYSSVETLLFCPTDERPMGSPK